MGSIAKWAERAIALTISVLITGFSVAAIIAGQAYALQLNARNVVLGSPLPLATTTHTFTFTLPSDPSNDSIQSVQFDYCTTPGPSFLTGVPADENCVPPAGINVMNSTLDSQTGTSGFTMDYQDTNEVILSNGVGQNFSGATVQFVLGNAVNPGSISNPSLPFPTFFVRISVYQNPGGVDTPGNEFIDFGAVSSSSGGVDLNTTVPPILDFCAAVTIGANCNYASGYFLQLGTVKTFSTAHAVSQFAIGTNASGGASVTVNGNTMASGNNTITAMGSPTASLAGSSQFGLNLRANSTPPAGANPKGSGTFVAASDYDIPNMFKFQSGDVVASTPTSSDFETFSVTYILNISKDQPVGVYDTTITYICAANF